MSEHISYKTLKEINQRLGEMFYRHFSTYCLERDKDFKYFLISKLSAFYGEFAQGHITPKEEKNLFKLIESNKIKYMGETHKDSPERMIEDIYNNEDDPDRKELVECLLTWLNAFRKESQKKLDIYIKRQKKYLSNIVEELEKKEEI